MQKISRITTQVKRKDRFNIFLTNGSKEAYGFSVDEAVFIEYRLHKGMELDEPLIAELKRKDSLQKSYTLAINFLSYRMRTKKEIIDYLVKKEVDEEHIGVILERLDKQNLIDDKQFAEAFVQTRINTSAKGPVMIKKELIEKGVSATIADEAVVNYPFAEQLQKIDKLIAKKLKQKQKDSFQKQVQQLQGNLIQKGFTQAAIQEALANIKEEKDDDAEWDALVIQGEKLIRKHERKHEGFQLRQKVTEGLYRKGFPFEMINKFLETELEK